MDAYSHTRDPLSPLVISRTNNKPLARLSIDVSPLVCRSPPKSASALLPFQLLLALLAQQTAAGAATTPVRLSLSRSKQQREQQQRRPVQPNPFQGLAPAFCAMTHSHFTHLRIHHLKAGPASFCKTKKRASRIAHACTVGQSPFTSTVGQSPFTSALVPLTLHRPSALVVVGHLKSSNVPQKSKEWFDLRKNKLTTSTFSTALGFWKGNRRAELWHEKVFEQDSDAIAAAARAAMEWGVLQESAAVERYKTITGRDVGTMGFVIHAEEKFGWLGASPDGLLGCFPEEGILEVKCPYNKGKPELGLPWSAVPFYYMPQLQGQMEILDREWVELYCWTPNGSTLFQVRRHRGYWELMHGILREFWWECVVPAKEAILLGREADVNTYRPAPRHPQTGSVISWSRKLASEARFLCREIKGHLEFQSR